MASTTTLTTSQGCLRRWVFPPQKPERRAIERDEAAIARWISHDWPRIKRWAVRNKAHIVFIDETGFLMHPLVRRTWAPRGCTPILLQRGRHYGRISAIGALSISPGRRHLGWYLQFHKNLAIRQEQIIIFLRYLLRHLSNRIVVVWDRLGTHKGKVLRQWLSGISRLHTEFLPAYAPELNPNEYGWSYLKYGPLANCCPTDEHHLDDLVTAAADYASSQQSLLRSFTHATELPIKLR